MKIVITTESADTQNPFPKIRELALNTAQHSSVTITSTDARANSKTISDVTEQNCKKNNTSFQKKLLQKNTSPHSKISEV